ncbi:MAG: anti-sigma factor [Deltaproteobacteria bacterium]|nr:anti-sigma factor [Deltaproteobacteria bacterium]
MIRCREASQLASKALDVRLALKERLALRMHLFLCDACSRYRRQIRLLHQWIRSELKEPPAFGLTPDEREALRRSIGAGARGLDG